jgi:hypothetical protein
MQKIARGRAGVKGVVEEFMVAVASRLHSGGPGLYLTGRAAAREATRLLGAGNGEGREGVRERRRAEWDFVGAGGDETALAAGLRVE